MSLLRNEKLNSQYIMKNKLGAQGRRQAEGEKKKRLSYLCDVMQHGVYCNPGLFFASGGKNESGVSEEPGCLLLHTGKCSQVMTPCGFAWQLFSSDFKLPWFLIFF